MTATLELAATLARSIHDLAVGNQPDEFGRRAWVGDDLTRIASYARIIEEALEARITDTTRARAAAYGLDLTCRYDALNPCFGTVAHLDGWDGQHWGGGAACAACTLRGYFRKQPEATRP